MADGKVIADILKKQKFKIKSQTSTSVTVLVAGNRLDQMQVISKLLSNLGAKIDKNLKGSSIGGIVVGKVKIIIKAEGRTGGLDVEAAAIRALTEALVNAIAVSGGEAISVKLKGRVVSGVAQVIKTDGTPKSDFHLADKNGKPLIHISHKKGSTPKDFQQWGGVTEARIGKHPEVLEFATRCQALYGSAIPNGESCYRVIKDKNLAMMSIFGVNYDSSSVDVNRVDVLIQGDPGLKKAGGKNTFELTATGHLHYHGDLPDGGFTPVLAMIYKGDRDQFGIKGARVSIYPSGGRNFKTKL
jgi:hypothetical protein